MTTEQWRRERDDFFVSREWRELRYLVIQRNGARCLACGRSPQDGVRIHVDHIVPVSKDWSKRLDFSNLQVLCEDCNIGKSNTDRTDWRSAQPKQMINGDMILVTDQVLETLKTNGSFTGATIRALLNQKKYAGSKWMQKTKNTWITKETYQKALAGVGKLTNRTIRKHEKARRRMERLAQEKKNTKPQNGNP